MPIEPGNPLNYNLFAIFLPDSVKISTFANLMFDFKSSVAAVA